uniref:Uncharacterized protein n=1 Tax=Megaselia scalaris TaxID=36166 RepID=T1GDH7_MEGSC
MKYIVLTFFISFGSAFCDMTQINPKIYNCFQQFNYSKEDYINYSILNPSRNRNEKCFRYCVGINSGILDPSGKINLSNIKEQLKKFLKKAPASNVSEILEICNAKRLPLDVCDIPDHFVKCFEDIRRTLTYPDIY